MSPDWARGGLSATEPVPIPARGGAGSGPVAAPIGWSSRRPGDARPTEPGRAAGFWRRGLAIVLDLVVLQLALGAVRGVVAAAGWPSLVAVALDATCLLVGPAAYFVLMLGTGGQSVGKWLLGVRVVTSGGERIGYARALGRTLVFVPSTVLGIGVLPVLARADRRALHDLIAGTRVVRAGRPRPAADGG